MDEGNLEGKLKYRNLKIYFSHNFFILAISPVAYVYILFYAIIKEADMRLSLAELVR